MCAVFGPADMQLSANTQVKTIEGHYTGHFKAVVTKPQSAPVAASNPNPLPLAPFRAHHAPSLAVQT